MTLKNAASIVWFALVIGLVCWGVIERRSLNDPEGPVVQVKKIEGLKLANVDGETRSTVSTPSRIAFVSSRCASCRAGATEISEFINDGPPGRSFLVSIDEPDIAREYARYLKPTDTLWIVQSALVRRRLRVRQVPLLVDVLTDSIKLSIGVPR